MNGLFNIKHKPLAILWFLFFITYISQGKILGQSGNLQGQILSSSTKTPIKDVHILKNNIYLHTSNDSGYFNIPVEIKDTLNFSCIGYKTTKIVIMTDVEMISHMLLFVEPDTIEIDEIYVLPYNTYQQFKTAFLNVNPNKTKINLAIDHQQILEDLSNEPVVDPYQQFRSIPLNPSSSQIILFSNQPNKGLNSIIKKIID